MSVKSKGKKSSTGNKTSTKEKSGITPSRNWDPIELVFGENVEMRYRDIQSDRRGILPAKPLFPQFALHSVRKESFKNWPRIIQVQAEKLTEAGFIYIEDCDKVHCYYCGVCLDALKPGAEPWVEHAKLHSMCPHVALTKGSKFINEIQAKERGEASISAQRNETDTGEVSELNEPVTVDSFTVADVGQFGYSNIIIRKEVGYTNQKVNIHNREALPDQLGIQPVEKVFPHYAVLSNRKKSFKSWPKYIPVQSKDLAEAGFFYEGVGDTVKCYYCGGGLRSWKPADEPWTEHAKWYPSCPHVALNKGAKFIEEIQARNRGEISQGNSSDKDDIGVVSKPKVSDLMDSPAVAAVLEFVDNKTVIRQAVEYIIKRNHSKDFNIVTAEDLMKIVSDIEEGKVSIQAGDETCESAETFLKIASGTSRKSTAGVANTLLEENAEDIEKIQMENEQLNEQRLCKICLKATTCVMFMPCGHCMSCPQCAPALKECPELLCRKKIKGVVRAVL